MNAYLDGTLRTLATKKLSATMVLSNEVLIDLLVEQEALYAGLVRTGPHTVFGLPLDFQADLDRTRADLAALGWPL